MTNSRRQAQLAALETETDLTEIEEGSDYPGVVAPGVAPPLPPATLPKAPATAGPGTAPPPPPPGPAPAALDLTSAGHDVFAAAKASIRAPVTPPAYNDFDINLDINLVHLCSLAVTNAVGTVPYRAVHIVPCRVL